MASWIYQWENGDVSLISAPTRMAAYQLLDQLAEPKLKNIKRITDFLVGLKPKRSDDWMLNDGLCFDEDTLMLLDKYHPRQKKINSLREALKLVAEKPESHIKGKVTE